MYDITPYLPLVLLVAMGLIIHNMTGNNSTTTVEVKKTRGRKKTS